MQEGLERKETFYPKNIPKNRPQFSADMRICANLRIGVCLGGLGDWIFTICLIIACLIIAGLDLGGIAEFRVKPD